MKIGLYLLHLHSNHTYLVCQHRILMDPSDKSIQSINYDPTIHHIIHYLDRLRDNIYSDVHCCMLL